MTTQLETFRDFDLEAFTLQMRNKAGINVVEAIVDAHIERTIEGASTLTVTVDDDLERSIQLSGKLGRKVDVNVDGLWFTLVSVGKQQRQLELTFEDRIVNALRYYDSWKFVSRGQMTRAEFVLWMIKEVKEFPIHYMIPELNAKQPVSDLLPGEISLNAQGQRLDLKSPEARPTGIPLVDNLRVKTEAATAEQIGNANAILGKGVEMGARRKVLVCSIMTAIQESSIINLTGGPDDSVGIFQQRPSQGWPASRNIPVDAEAFFKAAMALDGLNPNISYNDLCQGVQHSGYPNAYGQWQAQAEVIVNAFGTTGSGIGGTGDVVGDPRVANNQKPVSGGGFIQKATDLVTGGGTPTIPWTPVGVGGDYQFYRGNLTQDPSGMGNWILKKENSWDCMGRLAQEVNWRRFCVSGRIYYVSEKWLFQSKPFMVISEDSEGIDWIDYDYDEGKRSATIKITCHIKRWAAPPGSTVLIQNMGIPNGKWLVNDIARSLYDDIGTIVLKKPQPVLPEPTPQSQTKQFPFGQVPPNVAGARQGAEYPPQGAAGIIVAYAKSQLGIPYAWGTEVPGISFDCSGLTQAACDAANISIPRVAQAQYDAGPKVSVVETLQPGDLVFFDGDNIPPHADHITHCGIYIGGGQFIHAPHTGDIVKTSSITDTYYHDHYVGATRPWM